MNLKSKRKYLFILLILILSSSCIYFLFSKNFNNHTSINDNISINISILNNNSTLSLDSFAKETYVDNSSIFYTPLSDRALKNNLKEVNSNLKAVEIKLSNLNDIENLPSLQIDYSPKSIPTILEVTIVTPDNVYYWDYKITNDPNLKFRLPYPLLTQKGLALVQVNALWKEKNTISTNQQFNFNINIL